MNKSNSNFIEIKESYQKKSSIIIPNTKTSHPSKPDIRSNYYLTGLI